MTLVYILIGLLVANGLTAVQCMIRCDMRRHAVWFGALTFGNLFFAIAMIDATGWLP